MCKLRQPNCRVELATFLTALALFAVFIALPRLHAADDDDFDSYKIRLDGFWFDSNPSGNIQVCRREWNHRHQQGFELQ